MSELTDELKIQTTSPQETEQAGEILAALLPRGAVVTLQGDLATGKTCLVRGMARYFCAEEHVHSPTFTLCNEYGDNPTLYHLDLYRLSGPEEVLDLGYAEWMDSEDICVIEWAERAEGLLPEKRMDIFLAHGGEDIRILHWVNRGLLTAGWQNDILAWRKKTAG